MTKFTLTVRTHANGGAGRAEIRDNQGNLVDRASFPAGDPCNRVRGLIARNSLELDHDQAPQANDNNFTHVTFGLVEVQR